MVLKHLYASVLLSVLLCTLILAYPDTFKAVNAATNLNGIISSNTTWTKENSPYNLTGNVLIDSGVNLTIEPGVTVLFNGYFMNIAGTLNAQGTGSERIIFFGMNINYSGSWQGRLVFLSTSTDSILKYAIINSSTDILIGISSSPIIANNFINGTSGAAIVVFAGSPQITDNLISNNGEGISVRGGSPIISDNEINANVYGIALTMATATIKNNNITTNSRGVSYVHGAPPGDQGILSCNVISNNEVGILVNPFAWGGIYHVQNNSILNNKYGMNIASSKNWDTGSTEIIYNEIKNCSYGIAIGSPGTFNITRNDFVNNTIFSLKYTTTSSLNAPSNWWGTSNITIIDQLIYDFYDDFNIGRVIYTPILVESSLVPKDNPPIPETPSLAILTALLVALAVLLCLIRTKGPPVNTRLS